MATSGTLGTTVVDVVKLIEHAYRRCGKVTSTLGQEQLEIGRDNLYLVITSMINRGLNLWTIEKVLVGLATDQITYNLPTGTIDVLNTFYRSIEETTPTWVTGATSWTGTFTDATAVVTFGFVPTTAQTLSLVVATSDDNVTYTTALTISSASYVAGQQYWFDVEPSPSALYWRLTETVAGTLDLDSVTLSSENTEYVLNRINRDDYTNLPNKQSTGTPTQFWLDRQLTPRMWVWPMPENADTALIAVWRQRDVQDVGALTNTLEVPVRWYETIIWLLAQRFCYELPEIDPKRIEMITMMAQQMDMESGSEEYDNSPVYLAPNIGAYTR
jgi:hypothetical protein